ncbi:MAG: hypothetical protein FJX74_22595, partial [Armatimonadetes bacterium]|nr:hypothetical protein [Armatimonadota bacterium]
MLALSLALAASPEAQTAPHVLTLTEPILEPEDGLLLGNGDLSVSAWQTADRLLFRLGKGDVWDRRLDTSDDPRPPHIDEIAHGIRDEGWKCGPYGGDEPVALHGTDDPERMQELCRGAPPSYTQRPYPCPKPVGELAIQLPPDLGRPSLRQELAVEEARLRIECAWPAGVKLTVTACIPPTPNVLIVRWILEGWTDATRVGNTKPPVWWSLYRWADPPIGEFAQRFFAECRHGAFLGMDAAKCSPLPRPIAHTLDGVVCLQQDFHAEPTFPPGFRYLLAPFLSEGGSTGFDTRQSLEACLHSLPPAEAREGWLVVSATTSSDPGGPEAEMHRIARLLAERGAEQLAEWEAAAVADAARFWARSAVSIEDPLIESLWYETYHARRCTTRFGKTPPGLFLPSTVRDYSHWHGDYHTNYNYQQPFWGDYTANQLELGDAYFTGMDYFVQMGRLLAERYYGTRGLFVQLSGYPILSVDDALGAVPMGRMAYMTGWASNQYWWRYLYTRDEAWLRETGYPVLRDCALFYTDFMQLGADGLYHVFPSNQGEDGFTGDPKDYTDRGQVMRHLRYCLRSALAAAEVLGTDDELQAQWRERLDKCAGDDGQPPVKLEGLEKHFAEACAPELGWGRPYRGRLAESGGDPWPPLSDGLLTWYAGQYPVGAMAQLRAGVIEPDRAFLGLKRLVERWRHPNGLIWAMSVADYGRAGAWTETLGVCAPLQEMMLQSYGGVLRIFPCWPQAVPASFTTFRAEGAFLVSASWEDGRVTACQVLSERGGECRLYSPWDTPPTIRTAAGAEVN